MKKTVSRPIIINSLNSLAKKRKHVISKSTKIRKPGDLSETVKHRRQWSNIESSDQNNNNNNNNNNNLST